LPDSPDLQSGAEWYVYIISCSDGSLYTGITTDVERRFRQHASGKGARYFRGRQPLEIVYRESSHSRSSASQREARIKSMSRGEKLLLSQSCRVEAGKDEVSLCVIVEIAN
jgi:putative endonuclease